MLQNGPVRPLRLAGVLMRVSALGSVRGALRGLVGPSRGYLGRTVEEGPTKTWRFVPLDGMPYDREGHILRMGVAPGWAEVMRFEDHVSGNGMQLVTVHAVDLDSIEKIDLIEEDR